MTVTLDFVVAGVQRGGSTQLSTFLGAHPQVHLPGDEVPYFEDPFFSHTPVSALEEVLAPATPGARRGIHCPSYLARPEVAARIHEVSPDALILVVLRDPVARAISAYYWYVQFRMLPLEPAETGLARLLDGWSDPAYPQAWEVLDWSFYGRHLRRYADLFGRDQVVTVRNEELSAPGNPGVRRICERLGIDPDVGPERAIRPNAGAYDLRRLRILRLRSRWAWSWSETTTYSPRHRRLRHPIRFLPNAAVVGLDRLVLRRLFDRLPPVSAELDGRLRSLYASDVTALEEMLDLDLSSWRHPTGQQTADSKSPRRDQS